MHKILRSLRASTALTPAAMLVSALTGTAAQALPQNGTVAGGSATITQSSPGELDINQATSRAVIDWQSFSIGANETTRFIQPNSGSVAVNRVTGIDPSLIEGRLSANGQIVLVNPNGILFDKGARVNVGGLIASTSDISTANAMAGNMVFDKASSSSTATIVNRGRITAAEGGLVALVAPGVANSGVISARLGKVALASGNSWALDLYGDRLVSFGVNDQVVNTVAGPDNTGIGVANSGKIYADAGRVELTADIAKGIVSNAINMSGVIEASSIHQAGGSIVLDGGASGVSIIGTAQANGTTGGTIAVAGDSVVNQGLLSANGTSGAGGTINVSAQSAYIDTENASLSAAGTSGGAVSVTSQGSLFGSGSVSATGSGGTGGSIAMTAPSLALIGTTIDASGTTGGGTIDIGGGPQGSGALAHAQTVTVSGASTLTADAISGGNGGSITVWSDDATSFSGTASAKGGFSFGNGGTIEVSSAGTDSFAGLANASALQGTAGSLLLDPKAIIIEASAGTLPQFQLVDPNPNSGGNFGTAIVSLGNGNVVVTDPNDTLGSGPSDTGAAYLFNGITGQLISTLTGSYLDDHVGLSVTALTGNNNFVVSSPDWSGNKGAATLVNGTTGLAGSVSASNSLTGSLAGDEVGLTVTALANGNYVVSSPDWTGGKGAATFVNGALGLTGTVSAANSLIGSSTGDAVGASVTALTNGNYVVNSPDWDGTLGAATFANGTAGVTGTVSAANSLVGTVSGDEVGLATTALSNGNYVVASEDWHGGEGAATWGNGATGLTASVSSANSLTGTLTTDHVAASVTALANGNYVVASPSWGLGKGAAIWGNGATGLTGTISTANALTGSAITDHVGASVTALANGNYVVNSPSWSLGKGAATFANGILGLTGTVGAANSYTGSSITDGAGLFTTALSNGNYVVSLPGWNGTIGAAAFASGSLGLTGVAGAANALTGSTIGDTVGLHVTALSDGNYVVGSPDWNGNKGAATWASGTLGLTGTVSASNSLIGSTTGDLIGSSIVPLSAGGYLVVSASFDSGLGAVVLGSAGNILTGTVNAVDSILGTILESTPSLNVVAGVNGTFYIGWPNLNSGGVTVGTDNPNGLTYADNPSGTITITPSFLTQTLDTGTAVTLQANDDITVDSAIVENATGTGGALTLDAGRSLIFNAGIDSDNGNITLIANDVAADGVVNADRDPGAASITFNSGAALNAGTGAISIDLKTGAGNTNSGSNGIALQALNAATIKVIDENAGTLTLNGALTASGTGNDIVLSTGILDNAYGANVLSSAGRYIIYATSPLTDTLDGIAGFAKQYGISYAGYGPGNVTSGGDYVFYSLTPTLTISANDLSRLYGSSNPTLTFQTSGLIDGDTLGTALGTTPTFTTGATIGSNVGTYSISAGATPSSLLGYNIVIESGTLSVTPAPLTIAAGSTSRLYGGSNPTFSASYNGLVNNDSSNVVTGLTLTTGATTLSTVGSYTITAGNALASNYTISYVSGTLQVTPAALTVTADNASRLYGGTNPTFGASYSGLVNGDSTNVVTGLLLGTSATTASNVGSYAITATGGVALNYTVSTVNGTLSVTPAPLTITANNATRLYGGTNPAFTASYTGLVAGNSSSVVTGLTLTTGATTASSVGSYAITAAGASASNYIISTVNGTLAVTPAPLTVTANNAARLYGGTNPAFTASYSGLVNNDSSNVVTGLALSTSATSGSNVGSYGITASGASASNYTIGFGNGTLTVTPAPLTITANNAARAYGANNPTFSASYNGLVNNDSTSAVTGLTLSTSATTASNIGTYAITAAGAAASNYTISYGPNGTLTIGQAALTIIANNATRLYGGSNPTFSASYSGLVNGDMSNVVTGLALGTGATTVSNVGTYAITGTGAVATNYTISYVNGTLAVTPAPLTVIANNATRLYGGSNPNFTASYTGLVNNDGTNVVGGLTLTTSAASNSNVGTYGITAAGATASNYTISYTSGTLSVTPAPLTITASNIDRTYGAATPSLSASYNGLVAGDTSGAVTGLTLSTAATTGSNVGTYAITASGASASNYTIGYGPSATLVIDPAPLTVTVNNASRLYGGSNPTFTASYSGFENGDTSSIVSGVTLSTNATTASTVGSYAITANGAQVSSSNYTISTVSGTLSVTPAPLTVTAGNATRLYGASDPAFSVAYNGFVNGDGPSAVNLSYNTAPASANVGTYALTPVAVDPNYQVTAVSGTYTITPAPLLITPNSITRSEGSDQPPFSATFNTLVNGDGPGALAGLTFSTSANASSGPGNYTIMAGGATDPNYTISYSGVSTLTIVPMTQPPMVDLAQTEASLIQDINSDNDNNEMSAFAPIINPATRGALQAFNNSELSFEIAAYTPQANQTCLKPVKNTHRNDNEDVDKSCAAPLTINGF